MVISDSSPEIEIVEVSQGEEEFRDGIFHLTIGLRASIRSAFSEGTKRNYLASFMKYLGFCKKYNLSPYPLTEKSLGLFVQEQANKNIKSSVIRNKLVGIKSFLKWKGFKVPNFEFDTINLALKGIENTEIKRDREMKPIDPYILLAIFEHVNIENRIEFSYWSMTLICFFLLLRKSHVVIDRRSEIKRVLKRRDFVKCGDCFRVSITWRKTNQNQNKEVVLPLLPIKNSVLCPVSAIETLISNFKWGKNNPMFCTNSGYPLSYKGFRLFLKDKIEKIGLDSTLFCTHSLRRGGASWAFKSGIPESAIQNMGDWKSDCYKRYLRSSLPTKINLSARMVQSIINL